MSKKKTPNNNSLTVPAAHKCHDHFHMTLAEYALYDMAMGWTDRGKKPFFFDGPKLAKQFIEGSKNNMYWLEASLVRKGWFVLEVEKSRKSNGHWSSRTYRVLNHDEWVANQGTTYYDRKLKTVRPRFPNTCPARDIEGVIKGLPAQPEGTVDAGKAHVASAATGNGPVQPESPASAAREPSQCSQREKAGKSQPVLQPVEDKRVDAAPFSSTPKSPGRVPDRLRAGAIPPVQPEGTVKKPVQPEGTVDDDLPMEPDLEEIARGIEAERVRRNQGTGVQI